MAAPLTHTGQELLDFLVEKPCRLASGIHLTDLLNVPVDHHSSRRDMSDDAQQRGHYIRWGIQFD